MDMGRLSDSLGDRVPYLIAAGVVLLGFVALAWAARLATRWGVRRYDPSLVQMVGGLTAVFLVALGGLLALWIAIPSVRFGTVFTSLGVTSIILGFALKDILENFVAGILILWRRPFTVGDQIASSSLEGEVVEINFRSTVIRTFDGIRVYIPNGVVMTQPLHNFTSYTERRSTVRLAIDQLTPIEQARAVILGEVLKVQGVMDSPPPLVLFESVGDFANHIQVLYWTRPPTRLSESITQSDVTERLYGALQREGITFPVPIQSVLLRGEINSDS